MEEKYDLASANSEGLKLYDLGEYEKALSIFNKVLLANPSYEFAIINKGLCLDAIEDFEGAIECYDLVISESKIIQLGGASDVFYFKGIALFYLSKFNEGIEAFKKDIEYHEKDIDMRSSVFLGLCHFHQKDYTSAIEYYDKVIAEFPSHIDALNNKGACLLEMGEYDSAKETFNSLIEIDTAFAPAYFNLGIIEKSNNNKEKAKEFFSKVKELDSNYVGIEAELSNVS